MSIDKSAEKVLKKTKVKTLLISQPEPVSEKSPYSALKEKYNVTIEFRKFIQIEPVSFKDFRKTKIDILAHTAIIFTSRNAVDHFFRICKEAKVEMPADMKYFCVTEQTANYLQKYIQIRKRKIFAGEKSSKDLIEIIKKHPTEKYLYPCSEIRIGSIPNFMLENQFEYNEAVMYQTVSSNLSDLKDINYDIIAFFSPSGVKSLFDNFPGFVQGNTRIAAFGPTTSKAVTDAGLVLDIMAPIPNAPSMTGALELYIKEANGTK
jgi:uroporphyrinogen-III synthase